MKTRINLSLSSVIGLLLLGVAATSCNDGSEAKGLLSEMTTLYYDPVEQAEEKMKSSTKNRENIEEYSKSLKKAVNDVMEALEGRELPVEVYDPEMTSFAIEKPFVVSMKKHPTVDPGVPTIVMKGYVNVLSPHILEDVPNTSHAYFPASLYGIDSEGNFCLAGGLEMNGAMKVEGIEIREQPVKVELEHKWPRDTWRDKLLGHAQRFVVVGSDHPSRDSIWYAAERNLDLFIEGKTADVERAQIMKAEKQTTADLRFFDLHGPVKSCVYPESKEKILFSKDGRMVSYEQYGTKMIVQRNEQGQIISMQEDESMMEDPEWATYYTYEWENGYLRRANMGNAEGSSVSTYDYKDRQVHSIGIVYESEFEGETLDWIYLKHLAKDAYGNWTKCEFYGSNDRYTKEREIVYY